MGISAVHIAWEKTVIFLIQAYTQKVVLQTGQLVVSAIRQKTSELQCHIVEMHASAVTAFTHMTLTSDLEKLFQQFPLKFPH